MLCLFTKKKLLVKKINDISFLISDFSFGNSTLRN